MFRDVVSVFQTWHDVCTARRNRDTAGHTGPWWGTSSKPCLLIGLWGNTETTWVSYSVI